MELSTLIWSTTDPAIPHQPATACAHPFWQLYHSHKAFLSDNAVETNIIDSLDEDQIQQEISKNHLRDQIAHNIKAGVLMQTPGGEIKYSWRGMIYLWCQFLLDLVRL